MAPPILDSNLIVSVAALVLSTALLAVLSAAEAGVAGISRRRVRQRTSNGVISLLDRYIRQREQLLRALSIGASTATVVTTVTLTLVLLHGRELKPLPVLGATVAAVLAVTFIRQTARAFALLNPETTGLRLARLIAGLQFVFRPLALFVGAPARGILRIAGRSTEPTESSSAAELRSILETPDDPDADRDLSEERRMMRGILEMSTQTVRELMSPRTDLTTVSTAASVEDVMKLIVDSGLSRIPLYEGSIDHVVGVLYAKDLLAYLQSGAQAPSLKDCARAPYFVPETKRADELLADLRRDQVHLAIVVDEYGGTAGIITVEDLIEEIVGEIADEYDFEEVDVQQLSDTEAIVDARLTVDDLNELFQTTITGDDFDTVGGLIFSLLGRLAAPGDVVEDKEQGLRLRVLSVTGRRIKKVRVTHQAGAQEAAAAG